MTPNHGYTPAEDRKREQSTPFQPTGQQPSQQSQQSAQGQEPPQSMQQGQPTPQQGQTAHQGQAQPQSMRQGQPTPQTQSMQQGQTQPPQQFAQQPQPPQQSQQPQPPQPSQQPQLSQQSQQPQPPQPSQAMGQQQMQAAQPTQGAAGGQPQFGQPAKVQPQRQPQGRGPQQPLLKPIRVTEIITEDVVTAERDTPVRTVVAQMSENNVGSVVVVEDDRPIGIITDRKVALALEEMPEIAERTAEDLLHGDVFTADPSMNIFDAIQVMSDEGIRRLPIVDDNGALRGIVTLDDALVLLGGVVSDISDTVQSQSPRL